MKNVSVMLLMLFFIVTITNVEAQTRNKNSKRPKKTVQKKTARKAPVSNRQVVKKTTRRTVVNKPVKRVRVNRTRVVHYHYRHLPRRGAVVSTMNTRALTIRFGGIDYRFHSGVWYQPRGNQWAVVRPVYGIRVRTLPVGYRKVILGSSVYYYYYGTYYAQNEQEYEVVVAPMGAEVDSLPDGYSEVGGNEATYYELDDVYYMPSLNEEGEEILVVVEDPM